MNAITNPNLASHLSDDQLEDLLLGESAPDAVAHLAGCSLCSARRGTFTSSLADFNQATLGWAEARNKAMHSPAQARETRNGTVRFLPAYAWAFAAALLLVAAMLFLRPASHGPVEIGYAAQPAAVLETTAAADPQIAADNLLMVNIDTALNQPDPMPFAIHPEQESAPASTTDSASPR